MPRDRRHAIMTNCRSRAKEALARRHPEELRKLYEKELKKEGIIIRRPRV